MRFPRRARVDDAPLLDALGLKMGDALMLGDVSLRIGTHYRDRAGTAAPVSMSFAPRVMINQADIAATRLVQPASRLNYRFAVAGAD